MYLTSLDFLTIGQPWLPVSQADRINQYDANRKLFEGKHDLVMKDWNRLMHDDQQATMRIIMNWHKRLSTLWADLLLGESPNVTIGDETEDGPESANQEKIEQLIKANRLWTQSYEIGLDVSRFGTGIFKITYTPGKGVSIGVSNPSLWFPVVSQDDIKDIQYHVLAWDWKEEQQDRNGNIVKSDRYLKAEIHEKGKITTRQFKIVDGLIDTLLEEEVVATGVPDFLVVPIHGLLTTDRVNGMDDYTDINTIIEALESRVSQIARILDKHSDPNMYGPASALEKDQRTGQWIFKGGGRYFPVEAGEEKPGYMAWEGQLEAAFKDIDTLMEQLYFISETSPAAFGQLKSGLAESGSALRRLMLAPLAKVNRLRQNFDPGIKKVLMLAAQLESAQHVAGAIQIDDDDAIHIEWADGLPRDDQEVTNINTARYVAGVQSLETTVRNISGMEGEKLQNELDKIKQDKAAAAGPSPDGAGTSKNPLAAKLPSRADAKDDPEQVS